MNQELKQTQNTRLITHLLGRPIWVEHFDGTIYKQRARTMSDGRIITKKVFGKIIGNADGTFHRKSYCERWWDRETMFG